MRHYDLLPGARTGILELAGRAAAYDERTRGALTEALVTCFERLGDFPKLGRARAEPGLGIRSIPLNRLKVTVHYVAGDADPSRVLIARILPQMRRVSQADFD